MEKKNLRFWFRLAMIPLFLILFWQLGLPFEALVVLGAIMLVLVLMRGKMWRAADRAVERWLPFTKKWPDWGRKVVVVLVFIVALALLKQIVYFLLSLAGIDVQRIMIDAVKQGSVQGA
ncbi:MAG: hypothetical protein V1676_00455 [Candidatus Diapherotrites archaeon]